MKGRRYCLQCSPPGDPSRTKLNRWLKTKPKTCSLCNRTLERELFSGSYCTDCKRKYNRARHHALKKRAVKHLGGMCVRCGYNRCVSALHFHHRDPDQKEFTISQVNSGWEKLRRELDKCDLVCANCHSEVQEEYLLTGSMPQASGIECEYHGDEFPAVEFASPTERDPNEVYFVHPGQGGNPDVLIPGDQHDRSAEERKELPSGPCRPPRRP